MAAHSGERPREGARWHVAAIAVLAVLAAVPPAALAVSAIGGSDPAASSSTAAPPAGASAGPALAAAVAPVGTRAAQQTARWLQEQLDPSAYVLTDEALADELAGRGFPAQRLRRYRPGDDAAGLVATADPGAALGVVVATPALVAAAGNDPESGRALQELPVLARFGTDGQPVRILQAAGGSAGGVGRADEDPAAVRADEDRRRQAGRLLAGNPRLRLTPDAADALRQGRVDARLLALLAQLTAEHTLVVDALPVPAGEAGLSTPRRIARLRAVDGVAVRADEGPAAEVAALARAQPSPYAPTTRFRERPAGGSVLEIGYGLPSPVGLLSSRSFTTTAETDPNEERSP